MTRDDIINMAREAGGSINDPSDLLSIANLECFAALVAAAEREACAKVCDARSDADGWEGAYADECAYAIRARNNVQQEPQK